MATKPFILQQRSASGIWVGTNIKNRPSRYATVKNAISRAQQHITRHPGSLCRVIKPDGNVVWQSAPSTTPVRIAIYS